MIRISYRIRSDRTAQLLNQADGRFFWDETGKTWNGMRDLLEDIRKIQGNPDLYEELLVGATPFIEGTLTNGRMAGKVALYEQLPEPETISSQIAEMVQSAPPPVQDFEDWLRETLEDVKDLDRLPASKAMRRRS